MNSPKLTPSVSSNTSSRTVFEVLKQLSRADRPLGVAELHRIIKEPTSSTHRALMTLEEAGFASRFGHQIKFGPGPMVQNLIRAMIARLPLRNQGVPLLKELVALTEAPATLNARLGWYSIRVGWAEGRHELYDQRRIGQARLLHERVAPIIMLSTFSDERISAFRTFVANHYPDRTDESASAKVDRAVRAGREQGYLTKPDDNMVNSSWVSFPVKGPSGEACGALTLALKNEVIPSGGGNSEQFDRVRHFVRQFQDHLDATPADTTTPYDYLDIDKIVIDTGVESIESGLAAQ